MKSDRPHSANPERKALVCFEYGLEARPGLHSTVGKGSHGQSSGGGQRELVGLFFFGELRTVIRAASRWHRAMEAAWPASAFGCTAHPHLAMEASTPRPRGRGEVPKQTRPFVWYPTSPFTAYAAYCSKQRTIPQNPLQTQRYHEVDNHGRFVLYTTSMRSEGGYMRICYPACHQRSTPRSPTGTALRVVGSCGASFTEM